MFVQAHKCCINFRHSPRSEAKIKKINQVTLIPTRWQLLLLLPDFVERIQKPTLSSLIIKATEIMAHDNSPGVPPYDGSLCVYVCKCNVHTHTICNNRTTTWLFHPVFHPVIHPLEKIFPRVLNSHTRSYTITITQKKKGNKKRVVEL